MTILKTLFGIAILSLSIVITISAQTTLVSLDGGSVNVEGLRGRVVVLAVGASWLPLSDKQSDVINSIAKKYAGRNVTVYFVTTDSIDPRAKNYASDDAVRKFAFGKKVSVPVLRDSGGEVMSKRFKVEQVPSFIVLDKNGALVGEPLEGIDPKVDTAAQISRLIDKVI